MEKLKIGDRFCISYGGTRCHVKTVEQVTETRPNGQPACFCGCYQVGKQAIDVYYVGGVLLDIFAFRGVIK